MITTLTKQALPMLRYRTRDITRLTTAPCDCGRTHVRILRITGRNDDMLIIRGVNVYPSQIEAVLVGRPDIAPHYQLVVERHGILDHVRVEVEALPGAEPSLFAVGRARRQAPHQVADRHHHRRHRCRRPAPMPRSQGKAVRVRDLRPEGSPPPKRLHAKWPQAVRQPVRCLRERMTNSSSKSTAAPTRWRRRAARCCSRCCATSSA